MKMIIVAICALVAVAIAAPAPGVQEAPAVVILKSLLDKQPDGSYALDLETSDGVVRHENGELKEVLNEENKPVQVIVIRGFYTIPGENGVPQTINYQADENGYQANGDGIPKVPEPTRR